MARGRRATQVADEGPVEAGPVIDATAAGLKDIFDEKAALWEQEGQATAAVTAQAPTVQAQYVPGDKGQTSSSNTFLFGQGKSLALC